MNHYSERMLTEAPRRSRSLTVRPLWLLLVALAAILFQVYVPRFVPLLSYLDLPLLITVHFALSRGEPVSSLFFGASIGLVQDSLSHQPLGMFGIVKTLVGYFAASVSQRFELENPFITFILALFFYFFHQFFYWVLARALLAQSLVFDPEQAFVFGLLNAAVGLPLFRLLDKLKVAP